MHGMRNPWLLLVVCIVVVVAACSSGGGGSSPSYTPYITNGPVLAVAVADDGTTYIGGIFSEVGVPTGGGVPIDISTGRVPSSFPKIVGTVYAATADGSGGMYIGGLFTYVGGLKRGNLAHILSDGTVDASWDPHANGPVNALGVSGSTVYAGGEFTSLGSETVTTRNRLAAIDSTGVATSWDPNVNGSVYSLVPSGSTVYIGGSFSSLGTASTVTARNYIAAVNATSGAADSWDPHANGTVFILTVNGNTVYAGGSFTSLGSSSTLTTRNRIAAIDASTGAATSWNPGANSTVYTVAVNGSTVYAGGVFTALGSSGTTTRNCIGAIDATSGAATSWNPRANGAVYAIAVNGNTVYAGGGFSTLASSTTTTRHRIAAIDATTGDATSWDPNANGTVYALAVDGDRVYAGGAFTGFNCVKRNYVAAFDASGAVTSWDPNANGPVLALAVNGSAVYAGGIFSTLGSSVTTTRNNIAALDRTTGAVTSWDPNADGPVASMAISGKTVYLSGAFSNLGSGATATSRNGLAAIDTDTGITTSWDPYPNNAVSAIAVNGNTVYVGGLFTALGSSPATTRNYLAAIDATTGAVISWDPQPNNVVTTLAVDGGTVYAGGFFTTLGSSPATTRNYLAAIDATTGTVTSWNPQPNSIVTALAVDGGTVYAGGVFSTIGSAPTTTRNYIAAIDATGAATSWAPELSMAIMYSAPALQASAGRASVFKMIGPVSGLTVSGNAVYAGGMFQGVDAEPLSNYARISK